MSDRPEDHTGPESTEPNAPTEPAVPVESAEPAPPAGPSGSGGPAGSEGPVGPVGPGGPGQGPFGAPEVPWWRGPAPQVPPGPYGYGPSPSGAPYDPSAPGAPYDPSAPGGWPSGANPWQGGQWGWGPSGGGWGYQGQGQPATPPTRPRRRGTVAALATVFTVLALLIGVGIGYDVWNGGSTTSSTSPSFVPSGGTSRSTFSTTSSSTAGTKVSSATGAPSDIATIRAKVAPELVDINTVLRYETEEAEGTGMVLTSTGKVLTNNHVIEGATKISATDLGNGKTYSATVLGYTTRTHDIAVIQLTDARGLKTVDVGNSSSVKVGEAVVAIGNAGGTGGIPSAAGGSVTALDQSITASDEGTLGTTYEHLTGLVESNANIEPGDSGGPLVTTSGVVVGMDTAASAAEGYSFSGATTGQGYSIPINEAYSTAREIIAGKASTSVHIGGTAFLGVFVTTVRSRTAFRSGLGTTPTLTPRTPTFSSGSDTTKGAYVEQVIAGTPAESAGLAATDVITSVNGTAVTSASDLTTILLRYHPGDSAKVSWTTGSGQVESATIKFASGPPE